MPPSPCPHDQPKPVNTAAIFDRTALTLARTERLIKSWFPTPTAANGGVVQAGNGLEEEELENSQKVEDIFVAEPELYASRISILWISMLRTSHSCSLGVGAKASEAQKAKDERAMVDERLRRQIMGKDWQKKVKAKEKANNPPKTTVPKMKITDTSGKGQGEEEEEVEEEEESRSSIGRKRKRAREVWHSGDEGKELETTGLCSTKQATYLDEVLSTRNNKKRKKRNIP